MTKEELLVLLSSWENLWVAKVSQTDLTPYFPLLMEIAMEGDDAVSWRAAWIADKLSFKKPELLLPWSRKLVTLLPGLTHTGKKRQFLRMVTQVPVDQEVAGVLFDYCQERLVDPREPVAVKAYAMQILYHISEDQKELKPEVAETIRQVMEIYPESGIQARCRNLIRKLSREISSANRAIAPAHRKITPVGP